MNRNRLKLWLYMVLLLVAGAANLFLATSALAGKEIADTDARLEVGVEQLRVRERLIAREAAAVAAIAVRSGPLLEALFSAAPRPVPAARGGARPAKAPPAPPPPAATQEGEIDAAARAAVEQAAASVGVDLPAGAFWKAASPEWLAAHPPADGPDRAIADFLRDGSGGDPRRGYARINGALWYGVAFQAGEGAALALFLPLDARWAERLRRASGIDVTVDAGTPSLVSTVGVDAATIARAARAAVGIPVGVGTVPLVQIVEPIRMKLPLLFTGAPAARALSVPLSGVKDARVVLSEPTIGFVTPLARYQWAVMAVGVGLLAVGLLLGFLVKTEVLPQVPSTLVAAATRIERGDYSARAPEFLGALGTLAGALNKAAAAAEAAAAGPAPGAGPAPLSPRGFADPFSPPPAAPPSAEEVAPPLAAPRAPPPAAATPPAPAPTGEEPFSEVRESTSRLDGGPVGARPPEPEPAAAPAPAYSPAPAAAAEPPGGEEASEEELWRAVHADFLRVRAECGEPTEGLGYERFRPKLERHRDQLVERYACRTVRFQVYVKDGRAALKATPVR